MRYIYFISISVLLFSACQSRQNKESLALEQSGIHKVSVREVLQTTNYTYLMVEEKDIEKWLAVPKMEAEPGETYYYHTDGFQMTDFESKELGRTFETVYFLESVSLSPDLQVAETAIPDDYKGKVSVEKKDVRIEPAEQGITIAQLYSNKDSHAGKIVRIKGQVVKFNGAIMNRNWIHIQDGTEYSGKFDLTATTDVEVFVGETIILEGKISLDRDFGYGYSYEVLMEDAKLINN